MNRARFTHDSPATSEDPSQWDPALAERWVIGLDYGLRTDHSAIVVAGLFPGGTQPVIGVRSVIQIRLGLEHSAVNETVLRVYNQLRPTGRPVFVAVDVFHARSQVIELLELGIPQERVIATQLSRQAALSVAPVREVLSPTRKLVVARYNLGRSPLLQHLREQIDAGRIKLPLYDDTAECEVALSKAIFQLTSEPGTDQYRIEEEQLYLQHLPSRCVDAVESEMRTLELQTTSHGNVVLRPQLNCHDDLLVALATSAFLLDEMPRAAGRLRSTSAHTETIPSSKGWT